jgi:predicted nuclease with RNAse H fold
MIFIIVSATPTIVAISTAVVTAVIAAPAIIAYTKGKRRIISVMIRIAPTPGVPGIVITPAIIPTPVQSIIT